MDCSQHWGFLKLHCFLLWPVEHPLADWWIVALREDVVNLTMLCMYGDVGQTGSTQQLTHRITMLPQMIKRPRVQLASSMQIIFKNLNGMFASIVICKRFANQQKSLEWVVMQHWYYQLVSGSARCRQWPVSAHSQSLMQILRRHGWPTFGLATMEAIFYHALRCPKPLIRLGATVPMLQIFFPPGLFMTIPASAGKSDELLLCFLLNT